VIIILPPTGCIGAESLQLTITSDPAGALPGQAVSYVVTVRNSGSADIPASTLVTTLPAVMTYGSAISEQGQAQYDPAGRTVTLSLTGLSAGQEVVLTIKATVAADARAGTPARASVDLLQNGASCFSASTATTVTPAGIPVTGSGPGVREIQLALITGLSGALAVLLTARRLARRAR
jgi:uncharacterized repeat protein (TIGR01451 family)